MDQSKQEFSGTCSRTPTAERITDYLEAKEYRHGFRAEERIRENQARIKKLLHATEEQCRIGVGR